MSYKYFQPNEKDLKDKYGDCTIRALCKVLNCTWHETFQKVLPYMVEQQCLLSGMTLNMYKELYGSLGFEYRGISNKKGSKRPTVAQFAKEHKQGAYICSVAHHHVAVVNGNYYDTWDCGECCLYGYFELTNKPVFKTTNKSIKSKLIDGVTSCCRYDFGVDMKKVHFCPVCGKKLD